MYGNNSGSGNFPYHDFSSEEHHAEQQYQQYGAYNQGSSGTPNGEIAPKAPKPKNKRSGIPWYIKLIAGVAACFVISAGSIGGFVAMVNAGIVSLNVPSQSTGTSSETSGNTSSTITQVSKENSEGALTLQEVAAKVTPSVVCIQNYQSTRLGKVKKPVKAPVLL